MVSPAHVGGDYGPILAVVGGRFLPVDTVDISMDRELHPSPPSSSGIGMKGVEEVKVTLVTRRQPIPSPRGSSAWIFNNAYELRIDDPYISNIARNAMEKENIYYTIEMSGTKYEIVQRSERLL